MGTYHFFIHLVFLTGVWQGEALIKTSNDWMVAVDSVACAGSISLVEALRLALQQTTMSSTRHTVLPWFWPLLLQLRGPENLYSAFFFNSLLFQSQFIHQQNDNFYSYADGHSCVCQSMIMRLVLELPILKWDAWKSKIIIFGTSSLARKY